MGVLAVAGAAVGAVLAAGSQPGPVALRVVARVPMPGDTVRFDYTSIDSRRGLLFTADLGANEVLEVNIDINRVVRVIPGVSQVHGVLVVPALHRVYATATGANQVVAISEDTGRILSRTPTGYYADGLAYDPADHTIWITNELDGSETIIDAATGAPRGTVTVGAQVGNVAYDPGTGHMLVDVQSSNQVAVIDPATRTVIRRVPLPGCNHDHSLYIDSPGRLAFIACDGDARLLTLDLATWRVTGTFAVGMGPDVLAYDPRTGRLYVAAEDGRITVLQRLGRRLHTISFHYLAANAHVVAVDPATGRSYFPLPDPLGGHPVLLVCTLP
ncbi:MAG TPA: YncE family protein [Streptosporangiaceae bacterium]|nr:YncE family protein [Streptosporangiaceae bacterium]